MLLMIDNYDSFTFNVVQYLMELGEDVVVWRNDEISVDAIIKAAPEKIVISPGPCTPNEAGISLEVIERLAGSILYWAFASVQVSVKRLAATSLERPK